MAACIIEEASVATPIYCQTTHTMERSPSPSSSSSLEASARTTTKSEKHLCLFNFHTNNVHIEPTLMINQESTKKRRLSQTELCNKVCEAPRTVTDNSCRPKNDSIDKNLESPITPTRPKSLFLTNTTIDRPFSHLRTCLSNPSATSDTSSPANESKFSPLNFRSLPEMFSPPTKRLRPQTLTFTSISPSIIASPIKPISVAPKLSSINFISPTELADKLKEKIPLTIFDCGSPFRHSEHRIRNSILLRVANRISRKRLKTNVNQQSSIDIKQLNESQFIILYDDNTNIRRQISNPSAANHNGDEQLSSALKCACEEVQRYLRNSLPPILILNSPFNQFFDLYPNLCESLQPRSCPSSPINHIDESSIPQTAPPVHNSFLLPIATTTATITPSQNDIDNFPMTHIIDGLYIGSESNAKNLEELSQEQIRCIINVTSHVPLYHSDHFQYCHLPADDTQKQNLLEHFDQAYSFIHDAIEKNEKILVHCVAGISRSPAIVIGFLMRYAKMNMNDAYNFVKRKRSIVSPNLNFMGQLLEYEKKLKQEK
ncbi:unnamed protein product [Rotaria magnacalcarata]|uniref:Uncharacterized protein n=4 Tax=Rotaria magnacalcarata TaxID=392030 RepID=A0A819DEV9_9BILA|nr:unnamed protein product [Rotaria magnacalcarata]CAF3834406.1 unnamed protein product [Rotaria magnacalcarata]